MKIREILGSKGSHVVTSPPDVPVLDAMRVLVEHNIGSVVVVEEDEVAGILTERDILRLGARDPAELTTVTVREAMTSDLLVGTPDDDIHYCMDVMTENRIRHLPVIDGGELRGLVSIGDVVNACRRDAEQENRYLKDYIRGETR